MSTDAQKNEKPASSDSSRMSLDELKARRSQGSKTLLIVMGAVIVLLLGGVGYLLLKRGGDQTKPSAPTASQPFPSTEFLANPAAYIGNRYRARLQVDAQLGYDPSVGRLMVFRDVATQKALPVLVPPSLDVTFDKGVNFDLSLKVDQQGLLVVESLKKE